MASDERTEDMSEVLGERAIGRLIRWTLDGQAMVGTVTNYKASHYTVTIDGQPDLEFWVGTADPTARLATA
jgi:hypothetical protein